MPGAAPAATAHDRPLAWGDDDSSDDELLLAAFSDPFPAGAPYRGDTRGGSQDQQSQAADSRFNFAPTPDSYFDGSQTVGHTGLTQGVRASKIEDVSSTPGELFPNTPEDFLGGAQSAAGLNMAAAPCAAPAAAFSGQRCGIPQRMAPGAFGAHAAHAHAAPWSIAAVAVGSAPPSLAQHAQHDQAHQGHNFDQQLAQQAQHDHNFHHLQTHIPVQAEEKTPSRRLRGDASVGTPEDRKKRRRGPAAAPSNNEENPEKTWEEKQRTREKGVALLKGTPEYQGMHASLRAGLLRQEDIPPTPNPMDDTISKRSWERIFHDWREGVKMAASRQAI